MALRVPTHQFDLLMFPPSDEFRWLFWLISSFGDMPPGTERQPSKLAIFTLAQLGIITPALTTDRRRLHDEEVAGRIVGPCGTGKSHLAQALGHCALRAGREVAFYTQGRLFDHLCQAHAVSTSTRVFRQLVQTLLLILNDFGLKPLMAPVDELTHELVAERYECAAIIVTNNLDFSE